jgi:hypothetical protein
VVTAEVDVVSGTVVVGAGVIDPGAVVDEAVPFAAPVRAISPRMLAM